MFFFHFFYSALSNTHEMYNQIESPYQQHPMSLPAFYGGGTLRSGTQHNQQQQHNSAAMLGLNSNSNNPVQDRVNIQILPQVRQSALLMENKTERSLSVLAA